VVDTVLTFLSIDHDFELWEWLFCTPNGISLQQAEKPGEVPNNFAD